MEGPYKRIKEPIKGHTKFLAKFKSTEKNKAAGREGRVFYLNCLYCESGFYFSLLLVN